jgi:hypothetical protein
MGSQMGQGDQLNDSRLTHRSRAGSIRSRVSLAEHEGFHETVTGADRRAALLNSMREQEGHMRFHGITGEQRSQQGAEMPMDGVAAPRSPIRSERDSQVGSLFDDDSVTQDENTSENLEDPMSHMELTRIDSLIVIMVAVVTIFTNLAIAVTAGMILSNAERYFIEREAIGTGDKFSQEGSERGSNGSRRSARASSSEVTLRGGESVNSDMASNHHRGNSGFELTNASSQGRAPRDRAGREADEMAREEAGAHGGPQAVELQKM